MHLIPQWFTRGVKPVLRSLHPPALESPACDSSQVSATQYDERTAEATQYEKRRLCGLLFSYISLELPYARSTSCHERASICRKVGPTSVNQHSLSKNSPFPPRSILRAMTVPSVV